CPTAKDFFARQGDLTPRYFVYRKENQRSMAEKDPLFGLVDSFQTGPKARRRGGGRIEPSADAPPCRSGRAHSRQIRGRPRNKGAVTGERVTNGCEFVLLRKSNSGSAWPMSAFPARDGV